MIMAEFEYKQDEIVEDEVEIVAQMNVEPRFSPWLSRCVARVYRFLVLQVLRVQGHVVSSLYTSFCISHATELVQYR